MRGVGRHPFQRRSARTGSTLPWNRDTPPPMNDNKTLSILRRLPVILAVTAASYGLAVQAAPASR